ncbi:hypothetical protein CP10881SC42_0314 [Chlamydia avium]|uniref:Uncharacterized protein n=1 Tax=Chlamydia avium TaxID=1457141 RepID=A0ABN0MTM9_9CHLA|nr:hypothetical protein CP10881SC42_0314 [Chlamydia avium]
MRIKSIILTQAENYIEHKAPINSIKNLLSRLKAKGLNTSLLNYYYLHKFLIFLGNFFKKLLSQKS